MSRKDERSALVFAAGAVALWSTVAVAFKTALSELSPPDLLSMAALVSLLSLGTVLIFRNKPLRETAFGSGKESGAVSPGKILKAAFLGLLNPLAYYLVLFAAYDRLPAQAAQPLNYTWPLFLALLAAPISGRKPSRRDLLAVIISFFGVILISWRPVDAALDGIGVFLALGSGIIWASYWLLGDRLDMDGPLRLFTGFASATFVLILLWWQRGFPLPSSLLGWASVCWIGLFEMGLTFLLWNGALERTDHPARIGNLVYLGPFISLIWIRLFLGESIRAATVAGLIIIVGGILFGRGFLFGNIGGGGPTRQKPD